MATPAAKFRLGLETLCQIDALRVRHGLTSNAELVRFAINRMYHEDIVNHLKKVEKTLKKSQKTA